MRIRNQNILQMDDSFIEQHESVYLRIMYLC